MVSKKPRSKTPSSLRWWMMAVPALLVSLYVPYFIFGTPPGEPSVKTRILSSIPSWSHLIGGGTALLLGPVQFTESIRRKFPLVHRYIGRVYVAAVFIGGFGGLKVSLQSMAYPIGDYAFAILAIIWLITVFKGVSMIWNGDVSGHQDWMTRNFSLTYAAVMLRWQHPLLILFGWTPQSALTITAFSCWIPNLIFAEWYIGNWKLALA